MTEDTTEKVNPESVAVGAVIEVRPVERIPRDGEIVSGESAVDTSALTGESVPRSFGEELASELPEGRRLALAGDGINDAPVLMRADIGTSLLAVLNATRTLRFSRKRAVSKQ